MVYYSAGILLLATFLLCRISLASLAKWQSTGTATEDCINRMQCNIPQRGQSVNKDIYSAYNLAWAGIAATNIELLSLANLRARSNHEAKQHNQSWLSSVTDIELLRFLRAKNGNEEASWLMLLDHVHWRSSEFGADSNFTRTFFLTSPLHYEVFWMGLNKEDCPTLVIRTQIHDGIYYNEDPRVFTSFVVSVLEQGRELYGVGTERQMCVLIDRAGTVYRNGQRKVERLDMAVLPNLLELFRHMYHTFTLPVHIPLQHHYPDILHYGKIAPASWFFSMCYRITSRVMDSRSRAKFQMLKDSDIRDALHSVFDAERLPLHLYGGEKGLDGTGSTSTNYTSVVDILFDVRSVQFPHREGRV